MALAQIGPFTDILEAFAGAVGAGIVLGGFAAGIYGLVSRWKRGNSEELVLDAGYLGGVVGAVAVLLDLAMRYLV